MAKTYTTIQGDTWDSIAFKVYGDEKCATSLMASNYRSLDILVFSSGTVLSIPDLPEDEISMLPPWKSVPDAKLTNVMDPYRYREE